ncbi:hypothetical protein Tco_0337204 [Tanacetum coccineum]
MQVEVQRQMESQHMRQRELEAIAREEAREREWERKMDDINLMLKKFNNPHFRRILSVAVSDRFPTDKNYRPGFTDRPVLSQICQKLPLLTDF